MLAGKRDERIFFPQPNQEKVSPWPAELAIESKSLKTEIQIDENPDFSSPLNLSKCEAAYFAHRGTQKTLCSISTNLKKGTKYYWRAKMEDAKGPTEEWGAVHSFRTADQKSKLLFPKENASVSLTDQKNPLTLSWEKVPGATGYHVSIRNKHANNLVMNAGTVDHLNISYYAVLSDQPYEWTIQAIGPEDDEGIISEKGTFFTDFSNIKITLVLPTPDSSFTYGAPIELTWNSIKKPIQGAVDPHQANLIQQWKVRLISNNNSSELSVTDAKYPAANISNIVGQHCWSVSIQEPSFLSHVTSEQRCFKINPVASKITLIAPNNNTPVSLTDGNLAFQWTNILKPNDPNDGRGYVVYVQRINEPSDLAIAQQPGEVLSDQGGHIFVPSGSLSSTGFLLLKNFALETNAQYAWTVYQVKSDQKTIEANAPVWYFKTGSADAPELLYPINKTIEPSFEMSWDYKAVSPGGYLVLAGETLGDVSGFSKTSPQPPWANFFHWVSNGGEKILSSALGKFERGKSYHWQVCAIDTDGIVKANQCSFPAMFAITAAPNTGSSSPSGQFQEPQCVDATPKAPIALRPAGLNTASQCINGSCRFTWTKMANAQEYYLAVNYNNTRIVDQILPASALNQTCLSDDPQCNLFTVMESSPYPMSGAGSYLFCVSARNPKSCDPNWKYDAESCRPFLLGQ